MAMVDPPPRRSPRNPHPVGGVDWDMTSPLKGSAQFPCKRAPAGPNVQTYKAGTSITAALGGSARHNGGHCQFSLSYDQGKSFVVLRSIMGDCLKTESNYTVSLPKDLPGGDVIFAWSWVNAIGNREYYMNCADIHINGTGSQVVGPAMLVANLDGYPTIGEKPEGFRNNSSPIPPNPSSQ
ncbi:MAG: putative endoglucanase precursor [Piptocephalis tieghemiana]|nr:MAG: putative endoglucanase precursor [Piptocephalis tieghemiana]